MKEGVSSTELSSAAAEMIGLELNEVMTSPCTSPALAAGELAATLSTTAPAEAENPYWD